MEFKTIDQIETLYGTVLCQSNGQLIQFLFKPEKCEPESLSKCVTLPQYRIVKFLNAYVEACKTAQENKETFKDDNTLLREEMMIAMVRPKSLIPVKIVINVVSYANAPFIWLNKFWYERNLMNVEDAKQKYFEWPHLSQDGGTYIPCQCGFRLSSDPEDVKILAVFFQKNVPSLNLPPVEI